MVAIQILSDLHLEAPKAYDVFNIDPKAPYIALLGDIGCIKDQEEYFSFLLAQLAKFKFVFLVLGNHEPYHSSWPKIKSSMKQFEELVARKTDDGEQLGQFMLLDQTRFDIDDVTILGCTLFSHVPPEDVDHVSFGINDFYYIEDWDIEKHNAAHESDLKWLRGQIELLAGSEKKVIILTHYSPTRDERAVDPHHGTSRISSGFSTDLRETLIHKSVEVKLWAFGHTHFNCDFIDNGDKRIVANQRGYYFSQAAAFEEAKVVEVYLFRLHTHTSAGTTTVFDVASPAEDLAKAGKVKIKDLFQLPPGEAAGVLDRHLKWDKAHEPTCNLMSWTSSLLFVIQYGLYRHRKDRDHPKLSEVFLLVLDTTGYPKGTFVRDLEAIGAFQEYSPDLQSRHRLRTSLGYYFGEYLTQGRTGVEGKCKQISIQRMIDLGLFELCPNLGERRYWEQWANRVILIRRSQLQELYREEYRDEPSKESEVRLAITIAQGCFGDHWTFPIAAMLLSFRHRPKDDSTIVQGLRAMFTSEEIESLSLADMKIDPRGLPEVEQFQNIIHDLARCTRWEEDDAELLASLGDLQLN